MLRLDELRTACMHQLRIQLAQELHCAEGVIKGVVVCMCLYVSACLCVCVCVCVRACVCARERESARAPKFVCTMCNCKPDSTYSKRLTESATCGWNRVR
jgi:hypothetical protein